MILGSLVVGVVVGLFDLPSMSADDSAAALVMAVVLTAIAAALTVWLTLSVSRGKSWARWALLLFLALTWWLGLSGVGAEFQRAPLAATLSVLCIGVEVVACLLLFSGDGARWFAALAAYRARGVSGS